jgi:hypothetical protein
MSMSRIVMRLARNPGNEFADGDDRRGYTLVAPLTEDGKLNEVEFRSFRDRCTVRRFAPDEDPAEGRLARRGDNWFFDYEEGTDVDDEPVYKLGQHRFVLGEYVTVADEEGRFLTYKVTDAQPTN